LPRKRTDLLRMASILKTASEIDPLAIARTLMAMAEPTTEEADMIDNTPIEATTREETTKAAATSREAEITAARLPMLPVATVMKKEVATSREEMTAVMIVEMRDAMTIATIEEKISVAAALSTAAPSDSTKSMTKTSSLSSSRRKVHHFRQQAPLTLPKKKSSLRARPQQAVPHLSRVRSAQVPK